jgi:hypothetical protein
MIGANGFEPSTSWSRTIDVKQSNALNRRRITVQLPLLFGLLTGLRFLTLERKTFSSKTQTPGFPILRIRAFCFLSLIIDLSLAWSSTPTLNVLDPRKSIINTLRGELAAWSDYKFRVGDHPLRSPEGTFGTAHIRTRWTTHNARASIALDRCGRGWPLPNGAY